MALPDDWEGTFQNNALTAARMRCPHCENASTFAILYNLGVVAPVATQGDDQGLKGGVVHHATPKAAWIWASI